MRSKFITRKIKYTGEQLRSSWIYEQTKIKGDVIAAFIGPASVDEHMVDLEDIKNEDYIYSDLMLHFLVEHMDKDLAKAVLRQRILIAIIVEKCTRGKEHKSTRTQGKKGRGGGGLMPLCSCALFRKGNDIFINKKKLSVSIATKSPRSTLIHIGLNILETGAPIPVIGLKQLGIDPRCLANQIMKAYINELKGIDFSTKKVKGVK